MAAEGFQGLTPEMVEKSDARLERELAEQGLMMEIQDPAVLAKVARLVAAAPRSQAELIG